MVLSARDDSEAALNRLCRTYWPAVFAFSRRSGDGPEEALDLTQGFFEQLLARRWLDAVDMSKGRFRSFLLAAFTRYSRGEWRKSRREKRGGGLTFLPLEDLLAASHLEPGLADTLTPDVAYERRWVEALIATVMKRLEEEYASAGKAVLFSSLRGFLVTSRGETPYGEAAAATGLSDSGIKSAIFRMRRRYGEIFREEVAGTVASPEEVEGEIRHLLAVMGRE